MSKPNLEKLDKFLSVAGGNGYSKVIVLSPRNYEVTRDDLGPLVTADALLELCTEDAKTLAQGTSNEYVVTVASGDGVKTSRFPMFIPGGAPKASDEDVHRVDPSSSQSTGAVIGHMARTIVELVRQNTTLAMSVVNRDKDYVHELERSRRTALRKDTETTLVAKLIDRETEETRTKREGWTKLLGEVVSYLPAVAKALPGAKEKAIDTFRESMTDAQLAQMASLLGPIPLARIMSIPDPARLAAYFVDELDPAQGQAVIGLLSEAQRRALLPAMNDFVQTREREAAAAAAAESKPAEVAAQ